MVMRYNRSSFDGARIRFGRAITFLASIVAVIWFGLFIYLVIGFLRSPLQPNVESKDVVPWSNHGEIHYVRQLDLDRYEELVSLGPYILVIAGVGIFLTKGTRMFDRR